MIVYANKPDLMALSTTAASRGKPVNTMAHGDIQLYMWCLSQNQ